MRIEELKKIAEENDYEMTDYIVGLRFTKKDDENYITIGSKFKNKIWISIQDWCFEEDFKMVKAAIEYAETPVDERAEEKKFYLKHRYLAGEYHEELYFTRNPRVGPQQLNIKLFSNVHLQQFTLKEIEEIKEEFDTDLADFELVEAEE